ncbi:MAG: TerB family tellurite resistance protein [Alphaproteobacteria bacterium]|nr:TerB family tellurite resistance protein [Alphaproteobacteria bacterium]
MSIWGSLLGGVIGFSFGGPFGALLGSFLGGKISKLNSSKIIGNQQNSQEVFALSLIILSAKLSKADGHVSKEELIAVKDKLQIPDSEIGQVAKIFNKAKDESTGYEPYAKQIAEIFRGNLNVLEEVINILFYIAEADGHVSNDEETMIANIAYIFGLSQKQYQSIKESRKTSDKLNPYIVLESQPTDDLKTIRKNYIKLSKEHHPDLLISKGVPVEVINESKNKMRSINAAWDQVQKLKSN